MSWHPFKTRPMSNAKSHFFNKVMKKTNNFTCTMDIFIHVQMESTQIVMYLHFNRSIMHYYKIKTMVMSLPAFCKNVCIMIVSLVKAGPDLESMQTNCGFLLSFTNKCKISQHNNCKIVMDTSLQISTLTAECLP